MPGTCDWGAEIASFANNRVTLVWNPSFAIKTQKLEVLNNGRLRVETATHFTDNSGREDFTSIDYFCKCTNSQHDGINYRMKDI